MTAATPTRRTQRARLRREYDKAYRLWKATRKPKHHAVLVEITRKIIELSPLRGSGRTAEAQNGN